jgi:hypothetical protein
MGKERTCAEIVDDRPCGVAAARFNADSGFPFCDEHGGENPTYSSALAELVTVGRWLATLQPAIVSRTQKEADMWARWYRLLNEAPVKTEPAG